MEPGRGLIASPGWIVSFVVYISGCIISIVFIVGTSKDKFLSLMLAWGIAQATSWVFVEPLGVLFAPLVLTPRTACRIARNALKPPSWWPRLGLRRTKTQPVKPIVALESPVKAALEETARQARAQSPREPAPSPAADAGAGLALVPAARPWSKEMPVRPARMPKKAVIEM